MKVFYNIEELEKNSCVALGFFDGVHIAHQEIIKNTVKIAKENNLVPTVFTFLEKPFSCHSKIMTNTQREKAFEIMGIEQVVMVSYEEVGSFSADEFVKDVLHKKLKAKYVVCGENYHFGKGGSATCRELKQLCSKLKINVYVQSMISLFNENISSSRIKKLILKGEIEQASMLLGRSFSYSLKIKKSDIFKMSDKSFKIKVSPINGIILPKNNIYRGKVSFFGKSFNCNIFIKT